MAVYSEPAVGDDRTFERLYSSYVSNVFRYALTVVGQRADAEDVTQTTFMNAYRAIQRGERPEKPEQWLISIAHNACLQRFRHNQRRPREVALHSELAVATFDDDRSTTVAELQRAIEQLPPTQRAALVMRELEGRSYADMAATLQISVSALETLLFRARRTLREQLGEQLSCHDASAAIARQLEGRLPTDERRALRAHLRSCDECATLARSRRAQRQPLRGVLNLPFPSWVGRLIPAVSRVMGGVSSSGGIGAAGIAVKAAAIVVAGTVVGGGVYEGATHVGPLRTHSAATDVSRGASQQSASSSAAPSHDVATAAGVQPAGTLGSPPVSGSGQTTVPAVSPAPAAAGSSDAGGATAAAPGVATDNRQPAAETSGAQGDAAGPATSAMSATASSQPESAAPPTVPPGQAKKNANGNSASANAQGASNGTRVPPGQAKKETTSNANANANGNSASAAAQDASSGANVPPGQAKKDAAAGASPASSASEASAAPAASAGATTPPGQAKKDTPATSTSSTDTTTPADPAASASTPPAANVPPGQAKKDANAAAPAAPAPSDPASSTTTTPAPPAAPAAPKTPPGQAKKSP